MPAKIAIEQDDMPCAELKPNSPASTSGAHIPRGSVRRGSSRSTWSSTVWIGGMGVVAVCREKSVAKLAEFEGRINMPGATDDREVVTS